MIEETNATLSERQKAKLEDSDLIDFLALLKEEAKKDKKKWFEPKLRLLNFSRGKQWSVSPREHKFQLQINLVEYSEERAISFLTDVRPTITCIAVKPELKDTASFLEKACKAVWYESGFSSKLTEALRLAYRLGTSGIGVFVNPLAKGNPPIEFIVLDPRDLFIDPMVKRVGDTDKAQYLFTRHLRPLSWIQERYPERGYLVEADLATDEAEPSGTMLQRAIHTFKQLPRMFGLRNKGKPISGIPRVHDYEWWIKDPALNESSDEIEIGQNGFVQKIKPGEPLYPSGRHIIEANGITLVDEQAPFVDGKDPIDLFNWRVDTETIWGKSEPEALKTMQECVNKLGSTILENAMLTSNAQWIIEKGALEPGEEEDVTDKPGGMVNPTRGYKCERIAGVPLPSYLLDFFNGVIALIERIVGIDSFSDAGNILSSVAIDSYQLNAMAIMRARSRQMEAFVQNIFTKVIWRIFQYWSDEELYHYFGESDNLLEFAYNRVELLRQVKEKGLNASEFPKYFKIQVFPASELSLAKTQKRQDAFSLWDRGIYSVKRMTEDLQIANPETLQDEIAEDRQKGITPMPAKPQKGKKGGASPATSLATSPASIAQPMNRSIPDVSQQGARNMG